MARALILLIASLFFSGQAMAGENLPSAYAGSASCKECHEKFHQLWATSRHGLAMQPYTAEFAQRELTPQKKEIVVGEYRYRANIGPKAGHVLETGPKEKRKYPVAYVTGGKNVYYVHTLLEKGRLQTLPVAYDVMKKEWFDTAGSGVRHFPGERRADEPVDWKEWAYTFNSACHSCHVSQLSSNYDLKTGTYRSTWTEPGINCETCHGPAEEHIRIARQTPKGQPLPELNIIRTKTMTTTQRNDLCASCHAKMVPLTATFMPGERFFDHFDLVTLEDPDFYPDGRDLGENYTYTSWLMSPCAKTGKMDCMHCHTSSGRYRFAAEDKANHACLPCHGDRVKEPEAHTRHEAGSAGSKCISCHMPMTSFARMRRTDHSMRPPAPALTIAYKSPNACSICHSEKDAAWADKQVRSWRSRDYQAPVLERAGLIDAARKRDWSRLPELLEYIQGRDRDEVFAASLIRLLMSAEDERVYPVLLKALNDPSPLVRSSAAAAVSLQPSPDTAHALLKAAADDYRLVRVRAAEGLSGYPKELFKSEEVQVLDRANREYLDYLTARPDLWTSHYNRGNYQLSRGELKESAASYQAALTFEPRAVMAMVNLSMAHARMGETGKAEEALREALKTAPDHAAANFNMGLLKAEKKDLAGAERHLRKAFETDPQMAQAAYNLCIITAQDRLAEAVVWCRKATDTRRGEPRYAYTLAFYQVRAGASGDAVKTLEDLIAAHPAYPDAYLLLGGIHEKNANRKGAVDVYSRAMNAEGIPAAYRYRIKVRLDALEKTGAVMK